MCDFIFLFFYFPTTVEKHLVLLRDGRTLIGFLRSIDQFGEGVKLSRYWLCLNLLLLMRSMGHSGPLDVWCIFLYTSPYPRRRSGLLHVVFGRRGACVCHWGVCCLTLLSCVLLYSRVSYFTLVCLRPLPANLVFHQTVERIHVGKKFGDIPRGIFIVRGENVVLLGEMVSRPTVTYTFKSHMNE